MNLVDVILVSSLSKLQNLVTFASSKGASTSSKTHIGDGLVTVSYTHLRAHETRGNLVCRLLLEKKKNKKKKKKKIKKKKKKKIFFFFFFNDTATTEIYTE